VTFYSLQVGPPAAQLTELEHPVQDLSPELTTGPAQQPR
jgi:hypothetical protein